jgi:uncharacterized protein (TIGR03663 family)
MNSIAPPIEGTSPWGAKSEVSPRVWLACCVVVIAAGAFFRLYRLDLVPLHHDEGVNGFFLTNLFREHIYHYDPENYHGPTLYYLALISAHIFGLNTFAIRLTTSLFGIGTIGLVLMLKKRVGAVGALAGAALIAVSPGAIYLSRYFIHETLFVFFTIAIVVSALRYQDKRLTAPLVVAAIMAGLLFATKETSVLNAAVLTIAAFLSALYVSARTWIAGRLDNPAPPVELDSAASDARMPDASQAPGTPAHDSGDIWDLVFMWLLAAAVFVFVVVLMYSSLFTYRKGVTDALKALTYWTKTGRKDHVHRWNQYLKWLRQADPAVLILGTIGCVVSIVVGRNRFAVFSALLAIGLLISYSAVPYKTPWLALNMIVPLAIAAGCGIDSLYKQGRASGKIICAVVLIAALALSTSQAIQLNYYHYDDDAYAYVYAHTRRDLVKMVDQIEQISGRSGQGLDTSIAITTTEYWPLPWYLRDYTKVAWYSKIAKGDYSIVIGSREQEGELQKALGDSFTRVGSYPLRPGVDLILYARTELEPAPQS